MILSLLLSLTLAYFVWTLVRLETNVRKARSLKLPVVRIPFDLNNYIWVIAQPLLWTVLARMPVPWSSYPDFVRFSHRNWHFLEKSSPAARFGSVWALVSPGGVHLQLVKILYKKVIFSYMSSGAESCFRSQRNLFHNMLDFAS
jgi:hypothetical protein